MSILAANPPQRAVAISVVAAVFVFWAIFVVVENRRTAKQNVDSFLDAPNRKNPPDDEAFEGPRLDRFLSWALIAMSVVALSLPLYWLAEPGRQVGAIHGFDKRSVGRGEKLFGAEHNGFNCAACHGADGGGGVAPWTVTDYDATGQPIMDPKTGKVALRAVSWTAPRINNVALRYRPDQIRNILVYGRGGAKNNPMPAWGVKGGGPGNDQQIDDLVNYLKYRAIEENETAKKAYETAWKSNGHDAVKAYEVAFVAAAKEAQAQSTKAFAQYKSDAAKLVAGADQALADAQKAVADAQAANDAVALAKAQADLATTQKNIDTARTIVANSDGANLFNLNCARCHTSGWSYGEPKESGGGFYGPNLKGESLKRQFPDAADQVTFIREGVGDQQAYGKGGVNHWAGGGMPYFGNVLTEAQIKAIVQYERSL